MNTKTLDLTLTFLVALCIALSACVGAAPTSPTAAPFDRPPGPTDTSSPTARPGESDSGAVIPRLPEEEEGGGAIVLPVVEMAIRDLADRLGVSPDDIWVGEARPAVWPDASLGCPEPGESYAQVGAPGFSLTLVWEGKSYVYHTDRTRQVIFCGEAPSLTPRPPVPIEGNLEEQIEAAREDLTARLGLGAASEIEVLEARTVVWPDASLGCPQAGRAYAQVLSEGYLIRLSVDGRVYAYHGGEGREPFLCEQSGPQKETPILGTAVPSE